MDLTLEINFTSMWRLATPSILDIDKDTHAQC